MSLKQNIVLIIISFMLAGCGLRPAEPYIDFRNVGLKQAVNHPIAADNQPLRFAVSPVLAHKETIGYYRMIVEHLAIQTGRPMELIQRHSNAEVNVLLANGGADVALFSTGTYIAYNEAEQIEPLVMQQRSSAPYYYSYVVVPRESGVTAMEQLEGTSFAFTDPLSFSGHLVAVYLLQQQGRTPEGFFGRYQYTYSHLKALRAAANQVVDGAAIDSLTYDYAKEKEPELAAAVRIIAVSSPIGTGPVVVRKSMPPSQKELIRSIFLNMHHNSDMRQALRGLMIERFVVPQDDFYDYPREVLQKVRISS